GLSMPSLAGLTTPLLWRMRLRRYPGSWNTASLLALQTRPLLGGRRGWRESKRRESRAIWSIKMSVAKAIESAARAAALGLSLVIFSPLANAQQPTPAAVASAKELIAITGATALFSPLIAGVVEQAKVLYLQQ